MIDYWELKDLLVSALPRRLRCLRCLSYQLSMSSTSPPLVSRSDDNPETLYDRQSSTRSQVGFTRENCYKQHQSSVRKQWKYPVRHHGKRSVSLLPLSPSLGSLTRTFTAGGFERWFNLTVVNISEEDADDYTCVGVNAGGVSEQNVSLTFDQPKENG